VTEPVSCELVVNVRVEDPVVALMVVEVAFVACQFRVTLCPILIAFAFAEKTRVGGLEPLSVPVLVLGLVEHEHMHHTPTINPKAIPRTQFFVISSCAR
jgi:hypothetical protein